MRPDREGAREDPLTGGNTSGAVVRVGGTVRKTASRSTPSVQALLTHLRRGGCHAAPEALGYDGEGRQVLEYVDGTVVHPEGLLDLASLVEVGRTIRSVHDACASFDWRGEQVWDQAITPPGRELVCHNDLAPWNLVRTSTGWVFIDWDGAGPSTRGWDLGYAAHGFVGIAEGNDPTTDARRLLALVDGYGLDAAGRSELPTLMALHTKAMHTLLVEGRRTGEQPWSRLYDDGHADHWGPAAAYASRYRELFRDGLLNG